ncbi:MAG: DUF4012 domain-containing protein [Acidimicrobiia bacterium]|nr:DUF4012 domain-containing protein [Acidimicrobiia bacterium]
MVLSSRPARTARSPGDVAPRPGPRPVRRWGWGRRLLLAGLVVAGAWVAAGVVALLAARGDIDAGVEALEAARDRLSPAALVEGEGLEELRAARRDFERARERVRSPLVGPLRVLPVVGRQVRSVDALTAAAADVVAAGERAVEDAEALLEDPPGDGAGRVRLAGEMVDITARAEEQLGGVDLGPADALIAPLADARDRFADKLEEVRSSLADARDVAAGIHAFVQGPTRYLVLAANNAEMRAGSGMFLSAGVLTVEDGGFELGEMVPTQFLQLPEGEVSISGDLADRWGWLHPSEEWRNLNATPRFEVSAALARDMWEARTGEVVDGVMAVDPLAFEALLAAEGPVEVDGRVVGADDVVEYLLHGQYVEAAPTLEGIQARRDRQSDIARAAIAMLDEGGWEPAVLVEELRATAQGRHILAWSPHAEQQRAWEAAGISGEMEPESLMLSVLSLAGNKLDRFLAVEPTLRVDPAADGSDVTVEVRLRNVTPEGEPQYVAGPHPDGTFGEGVYFGAVTLYAPGSATDLRIDGVEQGVVAGPDGPSRVLAGLVALARGEERAVTVRFRVPEGVDSIRIEPSARWPALTWGFRDEAWTDWTARTVRW